MGEIEVRNSAQLVEYLAAHAANDGANLSYMIAARQLDAIFQSDTEDQVWEVVESGSTEGGRELEDVEFQANSFIVRPSTEYESALGHYIVIMGQRLKDGSEILINTQSPLIIGLLVWHERKGLLPKSFVIRGDKTPAGRRLWLEPVSERVISGVTE